MMNQVLSLSSIVLILACFLVYQAAIRSGFPGASTITTSGGELSRDLCGAASI
jgi:hypothetical protein